MSVRLLDGQGLQFKGVKRGELNGTSERRNKAHSPTGSIDSRQKVTDLWYCGATCAPNDITYSKLQLMVNPVTHVNVMWGRPI